MQYDFQQLSPHDLETPVRDLLQAEWGVALRVSRPAATAVLTCDMPVGRTTWWFR